MFTLFTQTANSGAMQAAHGSVTFIVENAIDPIKKIADACNLDVAEIPKDVGEFTAKCGTMVVSYIKDAASQASSNIPYDPSITSEALECIQSFCPTDKTAEIIVISTMAAAALCCVLAVIAGAVVYCCYYRNNYTKETESRPFLKDSATEFYNTL